MIIVVNPRLWLADGIPAFLDENRVGNCLESALSVGWSSCSMILTYAYSYSRRSENPFYRRWPPTGSEVSLLSLSSNFYEVFHCPAFRSPKV